MMQEEQDADIKPDPFICSFLLNVCGNLFAYADRAFSEIPNRGIVSWSAMIGGYAQHGHGKEALQLFNQMLRDGVTQPYYFGK